MCGRFTLGYDAYALSEEYDVETVPGDYAPRENIPPGTGIAIIGLKPDGVKRGVVLVKWGFVPRWANDTTGPKPINARSETAADRAPFRDSFKDRRCLIPMTGFYEWAHASEGGKKKRPYLFKPSVNPVAFAGLWDYFPGPPVLRTAAIITVPANGVVGAFHDRMPAMLRAEQFGPWLDPATPSAELRAMLQPFPDAMLTAEPVDLTPKPKAPPDLFDAG